MKYTLASEHQKLIDDSAISPEVAGERGYESIEKKSELYELGFTRNQAGTGLLIPIYNVNGDVANYQLRRDTPRSKDGKPIKYETTAGSSMCIDVPPRYRSHLADPKWPLFITEGVRKADSATSQGLLCIDLLGVWNWRGTNQFGGKTALPDWESIALNDRDVYICYDSDVMEKASVHLALSRLKSFLESRGAKVKVVYLPPAEDGTKVGLDDYLAAGHSTGELAALATEELKPPSGNGTNSPYVATPSGLVFLKTAKGDTYEIPLTNFTARITTDAIRDDGVEQSHNFEIEAELNGRTVSCSVTPNEFSSMTWVPNQLGAEAIIYPGQLLKDHARTAIQNLSGKIPQTFTYTHTGWRKVGEDWLYLHAGGGIGPVGPVGPNTERVCTLLEGALAHYQFPEAPASTSELVEAVRTSLGILNIAPRKITIPVLGAVYRVVLSPCDFGLHLSGPTGAGKSELAAQGQQHFGPNMHARNLPGNWSSTANALEAIAFGAKDALFVIDDFAPKGSIYDIERLHREADRLFRAQGNKAGRQRMRSNITLRREKPPRGLMLSTGEDIPHGQSLQARLCVVEVGPGDLDFSLLTQYQQAAAAGLHAQAMAGYIGWLAPQYENVQNLLPELIAQLRKNAYQEQHHRRTPNLVANLYVGLAFFLSFAEKIGAVESEKVEELLEEAWDVLGEVAEEQSKFQESSEPTERYFQLLQAALACGRAYVSAPDGHAPRVNRVPWGWHQRESGHAWYSRGSHIGWVDITDLYLEPHASYAVAQSMARTSGRALGVSLETLTKRLHQKGLLLTTETKRQRLTIRKTLEESRRTVLHLSADVLVQPAPKNTPSTPYGPNDPNDPDALDEDEDEHDDGWDDDWEEAQDELNRVGLDW